MKPGEYFIDDSAGEIDANAGRTIITISVANTGDRPIQVGSHFHFFEVNRALKFDRAAAYGMRLNVPAGLSVRFEPGETKDVLLTTLAGNREVYGHSALVEGALDDPAVLAAAFEKATTNGFLKESRE
jgi:urease beta subunit